GAAPTPRPSHTRMTARRLKRAPASSVSPLSTPRLRARDLLPGVVAIRGVRIVGDEPLEGRLGVGGRAGVLVDLSQREEERILRGRRGRRLDRALQSIDRLGLLPLGGEEAG